jgi:hypothetical protein
VLQEARDVVPNQIGAPEDRHVLADRPVLLVANGAHPVVADIEGLVRRPPEPVPVDLHDVELVERSDERLRAAVHVEHVGRAGLEIDDRDERAGAGHLANDLRVGVLPSRQGARTEVVPRRVVHGRGPRDVSGGLPRRARRVGVVEVQSTHVLRLDGGAVEVDLGVGNRREHLAHERA